MTNIDPINGTIIIVVFATSLYSNVAGMLMSVMIYIFTMQVSGLVATI